MFVYLTIHDTEKLRIDSRYDYVLITMMVTFKGGWGKLYYTQHTLLSNVGQLPIFFLFFLRNKHTHTQGRGKEILTQRHNTTPLKNHDNCILSC